MGTIDIVRDQVPLIVFVVALLFAFVAVEVHSAFKR